MNSNESSSFCNLTLEDSDLRKLQELDPFQTDGFQSISKISLTVSIVYTSETGKETRDTQPLYFQILTRWVKPQPQKGKEIKYEPSLDSMRVYLYSEDDIFLSMVSNMSSSSFQALKTKNELNLHFKDFPNSLLIMLKNCGKEEGQNQVQLRLNYEGTGKLVVLQNTEYKQIELIELYFTANSLQKAHQSIIYRYNYNKTKLAMIQNSIQSIYKLLSVKNAPLLAYIQKNVGI